MLLCQQIFLARICLCSLQPIFGSTLAHHGIVMKVICAWCEQEGRETLLSEEGLYDPPMPSHGICADHAKVMLKQIRELRIRQNPTRHRRRHSRHTSSASTSLPASRNTCNRMPTRRRLLQDPLSTAQLLLPFSDE